jgi:Uncharacterized conserved protein
MPRIELATTIFAPVEICFDCARDLDLHQRSMADTGEVAVAGRTSGRIELGEEVTWQARHFGLVHRHTSRITAFDRPRYFRDEMVRGRFRRFVHDHHFEPTPAGTTMRDVLEFASPWGVLGSVADTFVLKRYLTTLLARRNRMVKQEAEAGAVPHPPIS